MILRDVLIDLEMSPNKMRKKRVVVYCAKRDELIVYIDKGWHMFKAGDEGKDYTELKNKIIQDSGGWVIVREIRRRNRLKRRYGI